MLVRVTRVPTDADWIRCKEFALATAGKAITTLPSTEWKRKILLAEHSPIRTLMFTVVFTDIPYWVAMHFARHHEGVVPYIRTQRNDRQSAYDRTQAPQSAPVTMILDMNAQALLQISRKRLCNKCAPETREAWEAAVSEVLAKCPEFLGILVPQCVHDGNTCREFNGCGLCPQLSELKGEVAEDEDE